MTSTHQPDALVMPDPRTVDCEVWANREARRLKRTAEVKVLKISPKVGYRVLGGIHIPPNNKCFHPSPPWHYHFAVLSGGLVRDEIYPTGLPLDTYKSKFEFQDEIDFIFV